MHTAGLITEYNPFHNGHQYHIEKTKEITGADYIVAVMSSNYVQRGTPAITDKFSRTEMALKNGVDLVIELPAMLAASSAEDFAAGAVSLLNGLGVIDSLCFGSEAGDLQAITEIAQVLEQEPPQFRLLLQKYLKQGQPFPKARADALLQYLNLTDPAAMTDILAAPNNILGIEYMKALIRTKSPIRPYTIRRRTAGYHDPDLHETISSATAIRKLLTDGIPNELDSQVPAETATILKKAPLLMPDDFSPLLSYALLTTPKEDLADYADVSGDLADRIYKYRIKPLSFTAMAEQLKTKQYTYTRISRSLLHIILKIKKDDIALLKQQNYASYARILGFTERAKPLLKMIKKHSSLPVISKIAGNDDPLLIHEIFAAQLYYSMIYQKYRIPMTSEFEKGVIIIP